MSHAIARPARLVLATLATLLAACSGGDSKPAAPAEKVAAKEQKAPENELAKLVPAGTAIYLQVSSLERLVASIGKGMAAFDPAQGSPADVDAVLGILGLPGSTKEIDRTKPIASCLVLPADAGGAPSATILVPALSPERFVRSVAETEHGLSTVIHGAYVAVSTGPEAKPGPAPASIAIDLPSGDIVARLDVQQLVEHYGPMIDMSLAQVGAAMESVSPEATGGMDMKPFMKSYVAGIRSVLDAGQSLDVALRLDGNVLEVASALTVREGSVLDGFGSTQKTDAKALARFLDPKAPIGMVFGMDQTAMLQRLRPLLDATVTVYPEPMRTAFQKMIGSADEFAAQIGSAMCVNGAIGSDGLRYATYLKPKDAKKLVETYRSMMSGVPGITFDEMKEGEVNGVKVMRSRLHVDAEVLAGGSLAAAGAEQATRMKAMLDRMYGPNGLAFAVATQGDVTALVLGGDDAFLGSSLARLSKPDTLPAPFAHGLEKVGDLNPCFAMQYNLGPMMKGVQELLGDAAGGMPFASRDLAATFTVYGGVDGRVWRGTMSTDVAELGAAIRKTMGGDAKPSENAKPR